MRVLLKVYGPSMKKLHNWSYSTGYGIKIFFYGDSNVDTCSAKKHEHVFRDAMSVSGTCPM